MPATWKEKKESEEGLEEEKEKARWSAKGGNELDKDRGYPLLFHGRQACRQPSLCFFLTVLPRPTPVQKASRLPQFTLSCLFPLLSVLIQGPIQCCLPIAGFTSVAGLLHSALNQLVAYLTTSQLESRDLSVSSWYPHST